MTNIEIAELISERIGNEPIPFESVRGLALQIYQELGGTEDDEHFNDIYQILIEILPLIPSTPTEPIINDASISYYRTWSSHKINEELSNKASLNDISTFITSSALEPYATIANVDSSLASKADKTQLSSYAKIVNVDSSLALKADKTQLASYATIANVDASLANYATKNDISTFITSSDLEPYATIANVDSSLALKADKTQLSSYATIANVDSSLALKANASDLANYATIANVDSSLANYATIANVDSSLGYKATLVVLTQEQYDALTVKDSSTLYIISDAQ